MGNRSVTESSVCWTGLLPKLRRQFPSLQDEVAVTEVMEEAGRRIASREARGGPSSTPRLRVGDRAQRRDIRTCDGPATRLIQQHSGVGGQPGAHCIGLPRSTGSSRTRWNAISSCAKRLDTLSHEERWSASGRRPAFQPRRSRRSSRSVPAVDTLFSRAKQKIRQALGLLPPLPTGRRQPEDRQRACDEPSASRRRD